MQKEYKEKYTAFFMRKVALSNLIRNSFHMVLNRNTYPSMFSLFPFFHLAKGVAHCYAMSPFQGLRYHGLLLLLTTYALRLTTFYFRLTTFKK